MSKYITTWVCFLYKHLQEINWTPTIDQVSGTLPIAFKEKYSSTYCIIDAMKFSSKHHQTFLCNQVPGATTSIIIQLSFLLVVHPMA